MATETIKTTLTADGSQFEAVFKRAENTVNAYQATVAAKQEKAIRLEREYVSALQLEATGQKAAAAALRERITLEERAAKLAAQTGMGEIQALGLTSERMKAERQIAANAASANSPRRLPELALTPQYLAAIEKATARKNELAKATIRAGQSGMAGSMGFLAFSQAVEDAQYGIKGVLNNIPQMVLGFGGTMGLAGAISLAAVAAVTLYPHLQKLTGADQVEQIKKAAAAFAESWKRSMDTVRQMQFQSDLARSIANEAERRNQAIRANLTMQTAMVSTLEREIELRGKARALTDELTAARANLATAQGGDPRSATGPARAEELTRLAQDAAANAKIIAYATFESSRIAEAARNTEATYAAQLSATETQLAAQRRTIAANQARLADATARRDAKDTSTATALEIRNLERAAAANATAMATLEAKRDMLTTVAATAATTATAELATLRSTIQARTDENAQIAATIAQRKELAAIQDATAAANAWKTWQTAVSTSTTKAAEDMRAAKEAAAQLNTAAAAAARDEATRATAKATVSAEIAALQLTLRGRKDLADTLTRELATRREAAALAEQLGITEAKALAIVRARQNLTSRIASGERPGARTNSLLSNRLIDFSQKTGFRGASLVASQIERRQRERRGAITIANDPAAKYWERQLDLQEKLLSHLSKLGLA
jgi:hypothetical protein